MMGSKDIKGLTSFSKSCEIKCSSAVIKKFLLVKMPCATISQFGIKKSCSIRLNSVLFYSKYLHSLIKDSVEGFAVPD